MVKSILSKILFLGLIGVWSILCFSCNGTSSDTKQKSPLTGAESSAYFDSFTYSGNDDFYNENPLPDSDYYYNPILTGWYSDPSICTNGKDYFLVTSTFSYFPGVPLFHSTDLVNWKQVGHVLDRPSQLPLNDQHVTEGIFAPAISYNPNNETYYMITTNIRRGNFFVKTKDPFGDWSEPIWLPDVHGIDPSFFFDEDGKAYIVNNDEPDGGSTYDGHRAIRVIEFDVEQEKTIGESIMLVNGGVELTEKPVWIEGPHLYKINGAYYLMCAEGGTSVNHREVIFRSEQPMGGFEPWENNPILTQKHLDPKRTNPITCAGHADLIQKHDGSWWSVFLACRPINNDFENLGRETFLMPVRWTEDGFPVITEGDELVPQMIQMPGVARDLSIPHGNFTISDDFDDQKLGLEWLTMRGPSAAYYDLEAASGFLKLACAEVKSQEKKEMAYVTRRLQHHQFEVTTDMYFDPADERDVAGLLLMKDEEHQYFLAVAKEENQKEVRVYQITEEGEQLVDKSAIEAAGDLVRLKVSADRMGFSFSYAVDGEEWQKVGEPLPARYLSTANSFGFTGTTIGMFAAKY